LFALTPLSMLPPPPRPIAAKSPNRSSKCRIEPRVNSSHARAERAERWRLVGPGQS
jgi:hypothetical protein